MTTDLPRLQLERLSEAPRTKRQREDRVRTYFELAGCGDLTVQSIAYRDANNIICTIPGISTEEIVVAAHHDKLGAGRGVIDNWTGIITMMSLVEYYLDNQPQHTMRFIAFAAEEEAMKGSFYYTRQIKDRGLTRPRAMLNIDTLGLGDLRIDNRTDVRLQCVAASVAAALNTKLNKNRFKETTGDWEPFDRIDVPTLHFDSLNAQSITILHSYRDRRGQVDEEKLINAYEVIANTLAALDHSVDMTISPPR